MNPAIYSASSEPHVVDHLTKVNSAGTGPQQTTDDSMNGPVQEAKTNPPGEGKQPFLSSFSELERRIKADWPQPTKEAYTVAPLHMKLYYDVRRSGVPNYMSIRRPVPSDLNCDVWEAMLTDYHDSEIVDFLRYGLPLAYTAPRPPVSTLKNHSSATRFPAEVDRFL